MVIRIQLDSKLEPIVRQMAKEAGVGVRDMVDIAIYNLIGVWERSRQTGAVPMAPFDAVDAPGKLE